MAKCSFAKVATREIYNTYGARGPIAEWEYGTELYGRFFYLESDGEQALIAAFDFLGTFSKDANRWRRAVAERTGIPVDHIWYHELQVHAAPKGPEMTGAVIDRLVERCVPVIREMMTRAQEFTCQVAEADFGTECNFNREQYVAGLGGVTVWSGMDFDEKGRPYTQNDNIMLLRGYHPALPVFDNPIYFDNPADPEGVPGSAFSMKKGKPSVPFPVLPGTRMWRCFLSSGESTTSTSSTLTGRVISAKSWSGIWGEPRFISTGPAPISR